MFCVLLLLLFLRFWTGLITLLFSGFILTIKVGYRFVDILTIGPVLVLTTRWFVCIFSNGVEYVCVFWSFCTIYLVGPKYVLLIIRNVFFSTYVESQVHWHSYKSFCRKFLVFIPINYCPSWSRILKCYSCFKIYNLQWILRSWHPGFDIFSMIPISNVVTSAFGPKSFFWLKRC